MGKRKVDVGREDGEGKGKGVGIEDDGVEEQ